MKNLLYKEFRLSMQPLVLIFFLGAFMLLIPNYMYLVPCFFTGNSIFNSIQINSANNDILYTALLPVSKRESVKAKYLFVVIIQLIMILLFIPMMFLNHKIVGMPNKGGIDACPAMLGGAFLTYAVFNLTFLPIYYKRGFKADRAFLFSTFAVFGFIFLFECFFITAAALSEKVPFFKLIERTIDIWPQNSGALLAQLCFAAVCAGLYAFITWLGIRRCCRIFEKVDI